MNELHSLSSYTTSSLYGWDYHNNLGVLNADKMSLIMDGSFEPSSFFSTSSPDQEYSAAAAADFSSGYLEDALIEFSEHSKRRRLLPSNYTDDDEQSKSSTSIDDLDKGFLNFNPIWHHHQPIENFYCMDQTERICGFSSDEHVSTLGSRMMREEPSNILVLSDSKTTEETLILSDSESPNSSSSNSYKELTAMTSSKTINDTPADAAGISDDESGRKKKVIITSDNSSSTSRVVVVYPFAMVKAGGREGDVTLNDINERMLMAPTRPVRHPVGDFACRPCVSSLSPYGTTPGLSGKAVVALTRIHTQGRRGTITIIRTKG